MRYGDSALALTAMFAIGATGALAGAQAGGTEECASCEEGADCSSCAECEASVINGATDSGEAMHSENVFVLEDSIEPVVEAFNDGAGGARVVALVSSTCGICIDGARAVRESVLAGHPDADLTALIIWIPILGTDSTEEALRASAMFEGDDRVRQFVDENQLFGSLYSDQLLYPNAGIAWDMYMFYDADAVWGEDAPTPTDWVHQLRGGKRGDPARFLRGDDLRKRMHETTAALVPPPTFQLLSFASCPNSATMRGNLATALESIGRTVSWTEVDLESLDADDPRLGWGSPTILFNGVDLFGSPGGAASMTCRRYPGGVPSSEDIEMKIQLQLMRR